MIFIVYSLTVRLPFSGRAFQKADTTTKKESVAQSSQRNAKKNRVFLDALLLRKLAVKQPKLWRGQGVLSIACCNPFAALREE
jgi:hypothetical protein